MAPARQVTAEMVTTASRSTRAQLTTAAATPTPLVSQFQILAKMQSSAPALRDIPETGTGQMAVLIIPHVKIPATQLEGGVSLEIAFVIAAGREIIVMKKDRILTEGF